MKTLIKKWLAKRRLKKYGITNYTINANGEIDVDGSVDLRDYSLTGFPTFIQFGVVKGNFYCNVNNLTSLEGSPKEVGGKFDCSFNDLTSLKGSPKKVGGDFDCYDNKLTSLDGAPREIYMGFYCFDNHLTTLKGAPEKVGGYFNCSYNSTKFTEDDVKKVCKVGKSILV